MTVVVWDTPPDTAVTVIVNEPAGVPLGGRVPPPPPQPTMYAAESASKASGK